MREHSVFVKCIFKEWYLYYYLVVVLWCLLNAVMFQWITMMINVLVLDGRVTYIQYYWNKLSAICALRSLLTKYIILFRTHTQRTGASYSWSFEVWTLVLKVAYRVVRRWRMSVLLLSCSGSYCPLSSESFVFSIMSNLMDLLRSYVIDKVNHSAWN